jgi:hypothetical protein
MCRNIKTLFNFEPPATEDEIQASALQFVRKLSGFNKPSQANAEAFECAIEEVSQAARKLLASLQTIAPARDRAVEAEKARRCASTRTCSTFSRKKGPAGRTASMRRCARRRGNNAARDETRCRNRGGDAGDRCLGRRKEDLQLRLQGRWFQHHGKC